MGDSRARSVRAALVHVGRPAPDPATVAAEARLRATLDEVTALDLEVETLSAALADFARAYERALGDAFQDVHAAERLVRRIQAQIAATQPEPFSLSAAAVEQWVSPLLPSPTPLKPAVL